jgi:hypothetical protein
MRRLLTVGIVAVLLAAPALAFFIKDQMLVGEARNYTTPAGYHEVVLVTVSEIDRSAVFSVNGEYSEDLEEDEEFRFRDGSEVRVHDIVYGKRSYVEFYFSPGKGLPVPSNVGPAGSAAENRTAPCTADLGCLDDDPCTRDACSAGVCVHTRDPDCSTAEGIPRKDVPAAEPQGVFARLVGWLAGLWRGIFS